MEGLFDGLPEAEAIAAMGRVRAAAAGALGDIATRIAANEPLRDEDRERIIELARGAGETIGGGDGPDA